MPGPGPAARASPAQLRLASYGPGALYARLLRPVCGARFHSPIRVVVVGRGPDSGGDEIRPGQAGRGRID